MRNFDPGIDRMDTRRRYAPPAQEDAAVATIATLACPTADVERQTARDGANLRLRLAALPDRFKSVHMTVSAACALIGLQPDAVTLGVLSPEDLGRLEALADEHESLLTRRHRPLSDSGVGPEPASWAV